MAKKSMILKQQAPAKFSTRTDHPAYLRGQLCVAVSASAASQEAESQQS